MDVSLQEERGWIRLTKGEEWHCNVTNDPIDEDAPRVRIETIEDGYRMTAAFVSVSAVDELVDALQAAPDDADEIVALGTRMTELGGRMETGPRIRYVPTGVERDPHEQMLECECVICGREVETSGGGYVAAAGTQTFLQLAWIAFLHESCVDDFCEVLSRVWEHPEIIGDLV